MNSIFMRHVKHFIESVSKRGVLTHCKRISRHPYRKVAIKTTIVSYFPRTRSEVPLRFENTRRLIKK